MITAICYCIPQINRTPNVHGYSPLQWTLGYTPTLPGNLFEEKLNPTQLTPSMAFQKKLEYQQMASTSVARASNDDRLRRALLRKYRGNVQQLRIGQRCFYYRDLPQGQSALGPKITWRGPATVVMVEEENKLYWLAHGTSLIRAAYIPDLSWTQHLLMKSTAPICTPQRMLCKLSEVEV